MDRIYNPKDIEQSLYEYWEQQNCFKPNNETKQDNNYCIMMPPPNVTGSLHMGHAFQQTIMDILIRYQRMQGKNTLWQVGIDHAGIAVQIMVEQKIALKEGKTRHDYGRDAFINKVWQWKTKYSRMITYQMRRLGDSVDWERKRFTMDKKLSNAVKEVFIRLYQEDLIYRSKRLVNWDIKLRTAISDLEVEKREVQGNIWYLRYYLADGIRTINGLDYLVIATTRPETMLGDTGIAVHPEDTRYRDLIGQFVILPLVDRRIPIISDEYVNMNKGTGCVKITPAHDFNDYKIGKRHALPMINVLTFDGYICQKGDVFDTFGKTSDIISGKIPVPFRGLERFTARKEIVAEFDRLGLLVEVKPYTLTAYYGDRSNTIIEPMLTDQWYVRMAPLAKIAMEAVEHGKIRFVPKQYRNLYFSWMNNIQDWCISRQIWWGHRIPAWYDIAGRVYVGHSEDTIRQQYQLDNDVILRQDDDVLDTWFSSGLWTFASLGWPKNTNALHAFHPTSVVVSGFDIIFFWVARMIMLSMHFIHDDNGKPQVPFKTIYITGLIRDEKGQKMSKSKGNVIDPIDIVDGISLTDLVQKRISNTIQSQLAHKIYQHTKRQFPNGIEPHGADALRFTLASLASTSRSINWDMKRLRGYRNFCNKLWNASRFVLMNVNKQDHNFHDDYTVVSLVNRWIMAKFNQTVKVFRKALDDYRFDLAADVLYEFTWNQFCDWYLELTKFTMNSNNDFERYDTYYTLITVLEALLRLAHPIIPFITETIWQQVKIITGTYGETIMLQPFPSYDGTLVDIDVFADFEWIKQVVIAVRAIRAEINIAPTKLLVVLLRKASPAVVRRVNENQDAILTLAQLDSITLLSVNDDGPVSITKIIEGAELLIPMAGLVDKATELNRLAKETARIKNEIRRIATKLSNNDFINRAPEIVVTKEREKFEIYQQSMLTLLTQQEIIANL